jgi:integrase
MERVVKRGRVWHGWFYEDGQRVFRSTRCRDRAAAEAVVRQWERDAADPAHAAARTATVTMALQRLLALDEEEVRAGRRSPDTVDFHRTKAGHLVRIFETSEKGEHVDFLLERLRAADVDGYISRRRREGAADTTISKELVVLRKSLRLAIRAGIWRGRVEEVIPVAFSPGYEPRRRALAADELAKLLGQLTGDRAARVAFIVATSACWRETELARREDVAAGLATVLLRGTKRKTRFRTVPIVSPAQRSLLEYAIEHAKGHGDSLFQSWRNVRRDLAEACTRAKIERCSPNDLRRTFASWQVEAGVPLFPIAQAMGHKDTRMLERVYGRQTPEQLATLMARAMGLPVNSDCSTVATLTLPMPGSRAPNGPAGLATDVTQRDVSEPENTEAQPACAAGPTEVRALVSVPGGGIEPPTRGFSGRRVPSPKPGLRKTFPKSLERE